MPQNKESPKTQREATQSELYKACMPYEVRVASSKAGAAKITPKKTPTRKY